jgi:hypothetical protein
MHTQHRHHHTEHGFGSAGRGPEIFYGYCHDTRQMRMMNYADFLDNVQTGYTNLSKNPASVMQPVIDALSGVAQRGIPQDWRHGHHHECGCGCREDDCGCSCCIRCADVTVYARCGESRRIPVISPRKAAWMSAGRQASPRRNSNWPRAVRPPWLFL